VIDEFREILRVSLGILQSAGEETPSAEKDGTTEFVPHRLRSDMQHADYKAEVLDFISAALFQNPEKQGMRS